MDSTSLNLFLLRRLGRRQAIVMCAALLAGTTDLTHPTLAARGWCRSDPLLRIGDELVYVVFSAPQTIRREVTGPTTIVVRVPKGTKAERISHGSGFGAGEVVRFEETASSPEATIPVEIEASIPASDDLPVTMEFSRRTRGRQTPVLSEGRTNVWIRLSATVSPHPPKKPKKNRKA